MALAVEQKNKNPRVTEVETQSVSRSKGVILILDDEPSDRQNLESICHELSHEIEVIAVNTVEAAAKVLSSKNVHVLLLDRQLRIPDSDEFNDGVDSIPVFLGLQPFLQILIVTSKPELAHVVRAMSLGACNYLQKSSDRELPKLQIRKALEFAVAKQEVETTKILNSNSNIQELTGKSLVMRRLKNELKGVAESNRPLLILGETGTGKTTAAKWVHQLRGNRGRFVAVSLNTLSPSILERELFGHDKGAFTGALDSKPGIFEIVNGGTLFLDEIGEISIDLQVKLLNVLETGTFTRLGSQQERHSQFKLVCATNQDLIGMVRRKKFREELFMRISTFRVEVPSLKDRKEDVPEIIADLLPRCCIENSVGSVPFSALPKDFVEFVSNNPPDGNIRGIEHILSRLLVYAPKGRRGQCDFTNWKALITPKERVSSGMEKNELSFSIDPFAEKFPGLPAFHKMTERKVIEKAYERMPSSVDLAKLLKLSHSHMNRKLREYGLSEGKRGRKATHEKKRSNS